MTELPDQLQQLLDREAWLQQLLDRETWADLPSGTAWVTAMDPVAWIMLSVTAMVLLLGIFMQIVRRSGGGYGGDAESMPATLLERLQQNPTYLPPTAILPQIGAERVLELLTYGDSIADWTWVHRWTPVREELLRQMSAQQAFAPVKALVSYFHCTDTSEPASIRIRRTALIYKLGRRRFLPPGEDQTPAQLLVFTDGEEPAGELGFPGRIHWLRPEHRPQLQDGPMVELDPINFYGLDKASIQIRIYRSLLTGAGFRLSFTRVGPDWIVTQENLEWAR